MRTLVHMSDLHFGRIDPQLLQPLIDEVRRIDPDLVVVSGDLTQRARTAQFRQARAFLDELPAPRLVVPGNHDVPLHNVLARMFRPLDKYRRYICDDLEPCFTDDQIAVLGLNSARSLTIKNGRINARQLDRVRSRLLQLPPDRIKIIVTHHPLDLPLERGEKHLVGRARLAMETFAACGVDLLLAGHLHWGDIGDTAARYAIPGHAALVVHAGTATSTRGRGQPNSFNVIRIERPDINVECRAWNATSGAFQPAAPQRFALSDGMWNRLQD